MISIKKAIFALGLGIGLSASLNAWAMPGCLACESFANKCLAGDQAACDSFHRLSCLWFGPPGEFTCEV